MRQCLAVRLSAAVDDAMHKVEGGERNSAAHEAAVASGHWRHELHDEEQRPARRRLADGERREGGK